MQYFIYTHIYTDIHIYTYIYTHIYIHIQDIILSSIIAMKMKWTPKLGCQFNLYEHPNRDQGVQEQLNENSISTDRKWHRLISNVLLHETRVVYAGRELRGSPSLTVPPAGAGPHPAGFEQLQGCGSHNRSGQSSIIGQPPLQ